MIYLFLSVSVGIFLIMSYWSLTQRKKLVRLQDKYTNIDKKMVQLLKDYHLLVNADLLFARQLREVNAQLVSMDNQLQALENQRENDGGYQHALRILEMGGDKKEIIESCHLSNAEAELLVSLEAYRSALKIS